MADIRIPTSQHTVDSLKALIKTLYRQGSQINGVLGTSFFVSPQLMDEVNRAHTVSSLIGVLAYNREGLEGLTITADEIVFSTFPETDDERTYEEFVSEIVNTEDIRGTRNGNNISAVDSLSGVVKGKDIDRRSLRDERISRYNAKSIKSYQ